MLETKPISIKEHLEEEITSKGTSTRKCPKEANEPPQNIHLFEISQTKQEKEKSVVSEQLDLKFNSPHGSDVQNLSFMAGFKPIYAKGAKDNQNEEDDKEKHKGEEKNSAPNSRQIPINVAKAKGKPAEPIQTPFISALSEHSKLSKEANLEIETETMKTYSSCRKSKPTTAKTIYSSTKKSPIFSGVN